MTKQAFDADVAAACVVEAMRPLASAAPAFISYRPARYLRPFEEFPRL